MKQEISPKMLIAIVAALVLIGVGAMIWVWRAPTAIAASPPISNASPGRSKSDTQAMAQERRQEMLARKQHQPMPDANKDQ